MDKEHVKGAADKVSGAVKEGIGKATGDASLEAKGKIDKAKGEAREVLGDTKDAMKKNDKPN
ncbi:MAG: CsbD family protein [Hyphomonadaceae bacterium]|nr:CsbD family protein [Hyphomonadaceae bacterium]